MLNKMKKSVLQSGWNGLMVNLREKYFTEILQAMARSTKLNISLQSVSIWLKSHYICFVNVCDLYYAGMTHPEIGEVESSFY